MEAERGRGPGGLPGSGLCGGVDRCDTDQVVGGGADGHRAWGPGRRETVCSGVGAGEFEMSVKLSSGVSQRMSDYPGPKPQRDARAGNRDGGLAGLGMATNSSE